MQGLSATKTKASTEAGFVRDATRLRRGGSLFLLLVLVLDDLGLADQHRTALQLVDGLRQLEVLVAAQLGRTALGGRLARFLLGLLHRQFAQLLARGVLDLGALAAVQ